MLHLQEFDVYIKDKHGAKNSVVYYLSQLEQLHLMELRDKAINEAFPKDHMYKIQEPKIFEVNLFTDFSNYFIGGCFQKNSQSNRRRSSFIIWSTTFCRRPTLFYIYDNQVLRWCLPHKERPYILDHCNKRAIEGHYDACWTIKKVLGYISIGYHCSKMGKKFVQCCNQCQILGNLLWGMSQHPFLTCRVVDVWGIDFLGFSLIWTKIWT